MGFPPGRPISLPRINTGLTGDPKYGGFERLNIWSNVDINIANLQTKTKAFITMIFDRCYKQLNNHP